MQITDSGILSHGQPATSRAVLTFPTVTALADGSLLATCRTGSSKDSDDETIEFSRSVDGGRAWSQPWKPFENPILDGARGSLRVCYLTELSPGHLLAAAMWIDRATYPGKALFNEETEGCLPMSILLADSHDSGASWSPWRVIAMPADIGPPSLTNPILKLGDGSLAMSIETNKQYYDTSPWMQKVVFFHSNDQGQTWGEPVVAGEDPSGRLFNWDLRCDVAPDGRVATFAWTYDSLAARYLNIHRRLSLDHGHTWRDAENLDIADQAARPAMLADGRVLLAFVDRFGSRAIRARLAARIDAPFDPASEVILYRHDDMHDDAAGLTKRTVEAGLEPARWGVASSHEDDSTGELLGEMSLWTFGLPYAETLPAGEVLVVYYAGTEEVMDIHWARIVP